MIQRIILSAILIVTLHTYCYADKERANQTTTVNSLNGKYVVTLTPTTPFGEKGSGFAASVKDNLVIDTLWKVNWYARSVFLLDDGNHLVRFGSWARDKRGLTDLAVAFYNKGKLTKEYKVRDLVKDFKSVRRSVSHYQWESTDSLVASGFSKDFKTYTLLTTDNIVYTFNTSSGKIVKKKNLKAANSRIMAQPKSKQVELLK